MIEFLTYDLKVAVLLAVFYMFYRLFLSRETFHRVNRIVLLLTAVASFLLPLCVITMHETVTMEMPQITLDDLDVYVADVPLQEPQTPFWQILLPILFVIGMLVTLGHTLWSLFRIVSLISKSEKHPQDDGTIICVTGNADMAPFSWMIFIVMNRSDYEERNSAILTHERGHIRLHHSWDLLLVDTLTSLQWFNPAIWMLRSDLRAIHEYEADGVVLSKGINARQYQYLLITKAASIGGYSLANGISHSTLLLKLLALLPIVAITLAVNAETVTDYVYNEPQTPVKKGNKAGTINLGAGKTIVVEKADNAKAEDALPADLEKFTISGTVYDGSAAQKTPIIGAIVKIAGSKKGTVTDMDGNFRLEVTAGDRIEAIYMGFEPFTIGVSKTFSERNDYKIMLRKEGADPNKPYDVVEKMPQFPGGTGKLFEFLSKNVKYPAEAENNDVQGRVIVTFVVEKDGEISNAKVVKSIHPALDAEALRVINSMPNWTPGMQNGEAVRVKYTVPVTFRLQGKDSNIGDAKSELGKGANVLGEMVVVGFGKQDDAASAKRPLFVVDGVAMDYEKVRGINPDNISGMEILKDKAAIEKYGEKAKNGVVVIHTKKK